ncbi:MAG: VWA domain-containing protein [Kineosporiaceae bacterium]
MGLGPEGLDMTGHRRRLAVTAMAVAAVSLAAGCAGGSEPLTADEARERLTDQLERVDWVDDLETRAAQVPLDTAELADTLPPIDEFPVVVQPSTDVVAEVFTSTEKSGTGSDGWMVEVAEEFNSSGATLPDGRTVGIAVRSIASGTGYSFLAAGRDLPDGFSPSNQLWIEMANENTSLTEVSPSLVPNVAGLVLRTETADQVRSEYGDVTAATVLEATIAGEVVTGYTDPFFSSTGLNYLVTVLDAFAEGDADRYLSPDVASVFEEFQSRVPFVALTTLQLRESVERENGALDAFVMEWQTFTNTESLQSGFEFVPFGVRHDNPLYAVDGASPDAVAAMELFADFAAGSGPQDRAREQGFDPPEYEAEVEVPTGGILVGAQQLWKESKDGGRPLSAVFVTDVSGSMAGSRLQAVQEALLSSRGFVNPEAAVGMVEFSDVVRRRLPVEEFDLNQQARFAAAVQDMEAVGGTAMYDGILLGLDMLLAERDADPDTRLVLLVLTDGETVDGLQFSDVERTIEGLGVPIYTVGFEADLDELQRVSSLVESASINASEEDVEFQLSALFNAGV